MARASSALATLRAALRIERLPPALAQERARRGPGLARALFAVEPLALDPELPARRRAPWLRWLFVPERLDPR
jgi:hypothetical protein